MEASQALENLKELYAIFTFLDFRIKELCYEQKVQHNDTNSTTVMSMFSPPAGHWRQTQPILLLLSSTWTATVLNCNFCSRNTKIEKYSHVSWICFAEVQCASHWRPLDLQGAALFWCECRAKADKHVGGIASIAPLKPNTKMKRPKYKQIINASGHCW